MENRKTTLPKLQEEPDAEEQKSGNVPPEKEEDQEEERQHACVMQHLLVDARLPLPEPDGHVCRDQPDGDDGEVPRRDIVLERDHGCRRLRHQRMTRAISAFWAWRRFSA